jgi:hypothetical protein
MWWEPCGLCRATDFDTVENLERRQSTATQCVRLMLKNSVYFVEEFYISHMTEQKNLLSQPLPNVEKIPEDLSVEMRRIAHDLSNALEIIIQTSYLLSTTEMKAPASDWLRMLDDGVQKAMSLNLALRTYIKEHTSS